MVPETVHMLSILLGGICTFCAAASVPPLPDDTRVIGVVRLDGDLGGLTFCPFIGCLRVECPTENQIAPVIERDGVSCLGCASCCDKHSLVESSPVNTGNSRPWISEGRGYGRSRRARHARSVAAWTPLPPPQISQRKKLNIEVAPLMPNIHIQPIAVLPIV